jgi:drug/metabolite transporter (DMT)-like permease
LSCSTRYNLGRQVEKMQDPETQATLDRIQDRNSWAVGWVFCALVSLSAVIRIFRGWHARDLSEKWIAGMFLGILLLLPTKLLFDRKRRKPIPSGWLFMLCYALLMLAMETFGR